MGCSSGEQGVGRVTVMRGMDRSLIDIEMDKGKEKKGKSKKREKKEKGVEKESLRSREKREQYRWG